MHLSAFLNKASTQAHLQCTHISIYLLLLHYWQQQKGRGHINISRSQVMKNTRIQSTATYHKCIRDLKDLGYINYYPSYHPHQGSRVELIEVE